MVSKRMGLKERFARLSPPGMPLKQEISSLLIANALSFIYSLSFILNYLAERAKLYDYTKFGKPTLIEGAKIADFSEIVGNYPVLFVATAALMLAFIFLRYSYYRQGTKSIYLMKRLPQRSELHKSAICLPVIYAAISLAFMLLLTAIYFAIYIIFTPNQCLAL